MKWGKLIFLAVTLCVVCIFIYERPPYLIHKNRSSLDALPSWPKNDIYAPTVTGKCIVWIMNGYPPYWSAGSEMCTHAMNLELIAQGNEVWVGVPGLPSVTYEGVRLFDLRDREILNTLLPRTHVIGACCIIYKHIAVELSNRFGCAFLDCIHSYLGERDYWKHLGDTEDRIWVVYNTDWMRESYKNVWLNRCLTLHPPVDWRQYTIPQEQRKPSFVTLINCNNNKGGKQLIEIASKAPEFQFMGVKGGYDIQITTDKYANLSYNEHTPNIQNIYAKTWVLLLLSEQETYGRVAIEAMSSGIVVIAVPLPGVKEACGSAAIYHERNDYAGIIGSLRRLRADPSYYHEMSQKSIEHSRAQDTRKDMEVFYNWFQEKVVPSAVPIENRRSNPVGLLENFLPQDLG